MPTQQVITAAVDRAVETAVIDPGAPTEPRDERCGFDPEALAAATDRRHIAVENIQGDVGTG